MMSLDAHTGGTLLAVLGIIAVPTSSWLVARHTGHVQIQTAREQIEAKVAGDNQRLKTTVQTESERLVEERAQRVAGELNTLVGGLNEQMSGLRADHVQMRTELLDLRTENKTQRHDMDAIAAQKAVLTAHVEKQDDRIADLESRDRIKTSRLEQLTVRLQSAFDHIKVLTQALVDYGHEPPPLPPELQDFSRRTAQDARAKYDDAGKRGGV